MRSAESWSYPRFLPLHEKVRARAPYICRIAPFANGFEFDFKDSKTDAKYNLIWKERDSEEAHVIALESFKGKVACLEAGKDYAFRVERDDGVSSTERLVRTGEVPGIVVNYLHPDDPEYAFSGRYLCSPSLIRLENGDLLASMDLYASGAPQNLT